VRIEGDAHAGGIIANVDAARPTTMKSADFAAAPTETTLLEETYAQSQGSEEIPYEVRR